MEENWKPANVRYKELGRTDGQTVARGRVVMTNGAKNVEIVSVSPILTRSTRASPGRGSKWKRGPGGWQMGRSY